MGQLAWLFFFYKFACNLTWSYLAKNPTIPQTVCCILLLRLLAITILSDNLVYIFFIFFHFRLHNKGVYFRAGLKKMVKGYSKTLAHEVEIEVIQHVYLGLWVILCNRT